MNPGFTQQLRVENAHLKAALRQLIDFYDEHQLKMGAIARQLENRKVTSSRLLPKLDLHMAQIVRANNAAARLLGNEDKLPKKRKPRKRELQ